MVKIVILFFFTSFSVLHSQNKQLLFGFKDIPQTLMINPGSEVIFEKHVGFPMLSGFSLEIGSNGFTTYDLFADDGIHINDKLRNLIFNLNPKDHVAINQQLEIFNIGFRLKNEKDYLSFGIYQEFDFINYHPKDAAILFYRGNTDENGNIALNRFYDLSDINIKGDLLSVFHIGISRRLNQKLTIGARAKIYSGAYNFSSTNNKGTFTTVEGTNNTYQHQFRNVNFALRSSGIIENDDLSENLISTTVKNLFIGGNLGLGIDLGFTYKYRDDITITSSIVDLGFVSYSKDVNTHKLKGDYNLDGIGLLFPPTTGNDQVDYWDNLLIEFDRELNRKESSSAYVSARPIKLNSGVTYQFGNRIERKRKRSGVLCPIPTFDTTYRQNEIGAQLYSVFRAKQPQVALSAFYYRHISNTFKDFKDHFKY